VSRPISEPEASGRLPFRPVTPGRGLRRAGWCLAELALLAALAGSAPAAGADDVTARLGSLTVSASALRQGPSGTLTADLQVTTSAQPSDQLDAAIAAGGAPVAVYHRLVSVGEIPDLASCDIGQPPPAVVDRWLRYGPLLVPGRSGGASPPADATLTVQPAAPLPAGGILAITLYFAHAGSLILRLPVESAVRSATRPG
jgi:hypothetical protein